MEDESRKEEFDPTHPKMATGRPGGVYGAAPVRKSSFLENSESKIKILESKSNKTLKVAWNPKNHMLVFGGDNEYSSLWNMSENVVTSEEISSLPHVAPELPNKSMMHTTTTINSIDWRPDGS
mmetsp:Transcript_5004/g.4795  ORF Transcript_5004/g.4795 Transcript_5004/m.4795 type:complete len:123 (-) Transcript_5004:938-1306(-)